VSSKGHYFRPYAPAMLERSNPDMSKDREIEAKQRDADRRFVIALAEAFQRGDHLPAVKPEPRRTRPVPTPTTRPSLFAVWEDDNA
jgi:hypothetical protein